jgi:soluble lytic murein transglycosylase
MALWLNRLERVGERWRPGQVSPAGARGPMQVTLLGAKQAAKILGIKLDINRWINDPDYGRMLGQTDAAYLLQRYGGDIVLATAAYNCGAHKLDKLIKGIGDPRRGEISHEQFTQNIRGKETRQYVKRVVYDNYTEERPDPKRTGSGRRLLPPLRPQKEWLSGG